MMPCPSCNKPIVIAARGEGCRDLQVGICPYPECSARLAILRNAPDDLLPFTRARVRHRLAMAPRWIGGSLAFVALLALPAVISIPTAVEGRWGLAALPIAWSLVTVVMVAWMAIASVRAKPPIRIDLRLQRVLFGPRF
jgi:hypothetical protein